MILSDQAKGRLRAGLRAAGPLFLLVLSLAAAPHAEALPGILSATLDSDGVLLTIVFDDTVDASDIDPSKIHVRDGGALSGGATFAGGLLSSAEPDTVRLAVPHNARAIVAGYASPTLHFDAGALEKGGEAFPPVFAFPRDDAAPFFALAEATPQGLAFSPDGTLMFAVGSTQDTVFRYALDPPHDVASAVLSGSYSVRSEENNPRGLAFSPDGTRMFVAGGTDFVYQYSLGEPFGFDPAPAFDGSIDVSASDTEVSGLDFGDGGLRMYISGYQRGSIYQYDLAEPYEIAGAVSAGSYDVGAEDGRPRGVVVSEDGRTMLILGQSTTSVYRYYLGEAFDVEAAMLVESMPVAESENSPRGLAASGDGRTVFVTGAIDDRVYAHELGDPYDLSGSLHIPGGNTGVPGESSPNGVVFAPDGTVMLVVGSGRDLVYRYELPHPYDTGGAALDSVSRTRPAARSPEGIAFSNNGSVMLILDRGTSSIYGYNLAEPYSPANETHTSAFSVAAHEATPTGIGLASDGSSVFVTGSDSDSVHRFGLGGNLDLESAVHLSSFDASPYVTGPTGVAISADGHKLFISERVTDRVHRFEMADPYEIAAAVYVDSLDASAQDDVLLDITFAADGSALFAVGGRNDMVYAYALGSAYDITPSAKVISVASSVTSGLALSENGAIMAQAGGSTIGGSALGTPYAIHTAIPSNIVAPPGEDNLSGVAFSDDGRFMYVVGRDLLTVYRYTMNPPFDISTATLNSQSLPLPGGVNPAADAPTGLDISDDGRYLYVSDDNGNIYRFDLGGPYRLNSGTFSSALYVGGNITAPHGVYVAPGGNIMIVADRDDGSIHRYEMATPYVPGGATDRGSFDISGTDGAPVGVGFAGGQHMYVAGNDTGKVYQYLADTHPIQAAGTGPRLLSAVLDNGTLRATFDGMIDAGSIQAGMITIRDGHGSNTGIPLLLPEGAADSEVVTFVVPEEYRAEAASYGDPSLHVPATALSGIGGGSFVPDFTGGSLLSPLYRHEREFQSEGITSTERSDRYSLTVIPDGSQMYVGGADGNITWYDLGTPYDITTGVRAGSDILPPYRSAGRNVVPSITGIAFSDDGTQLFAANRGARIAMYQMDSPYEIESASITGTLLTGFQSGIAFSDDGMRIFAALFTENAVRQYDLDSPYEISSGVDAGQYDLDIPPYPGILFLPTSGVHFSPDGAMMFVGEWISDTEDANANRDVHVNKWHRYALSTPFDVLTAERVDTYEYNTGPAGDLEDFSLSQDGRRAYTLTGERVSSSEHIITLAQYRLPEPFDVTPPYLVPSFNVSQGGNLADPYGMAFSPDGTRLLVSGHGETNTKLFHLDPPFDITSGIFQGHSRFYPEGLASETIPSGVALSADGSRIFLSDRDRGAVSQYTLDAPFDVEFNSEIRIDVQLDVSAQDALPGGLAFTPDGTGLFMVGGQGGSVHMYSLNTPFDLGGAAHEISFAVQDRASDPLGIAFDRDGTEMLIADTGGFVHRYILDAPYDISAPAYNGLFDAGGGIRDVAVGGGSMFILGETDRIYRHSPGTYPVVSALDGPVLASAAIDARVAAAEALFDRAVDLGGIDPGGIRITDGAAAGGVEISGSAISGGRDPGVVRFELSDVDNATVSGYAEPRMIFERYAVPGLSGGSFPSQTGNSTELEAVIPLPGSETSLTGAAFSADGMMAFAAGSSTGRVFAYSLGGAFDVSSAVRAGSAPLGAAPGISGLAFSSDGRSMLVADETGGIRRYLAGSPYGIGDVELVESVSLSPRSEDLAGIAFSHDGMTMLAADGSGSVHRYLLQSPYSISEAEYSESAIVGGSPSGIEFSSDGLRMVVPDSGSETAQVYSLAAPYTIDGAEQILPLMLGPGAEGAALSADGTRMLVPGSGVSQYSLSSRNLQVCTDVLELDEGECDEGIRVSEGAGTGEAASLAISISVLEGPLLSESAPYTRDVSVSGRDAPLLDRTLALGFGLMTTDAPVILGLGRAAGSIPGVIEAPGYAETVMRAVSITATDAPRVDEPEFVPLPDMSNGTDAAGFGEPVFLAVSLGVTDSPGLRELDMQDSGSGTPRMRSAEFRAGALTMEFDGRINASSIQPDRIHVRNGHSASGGIPFSSVREAGPRTAVLTMDAAPALEAHGYAEPILYLDAGALQGENGSPIPRPFELPLPKHIESYPLVSIEDNVRGMAFAPDGTRAFTSGGSGRLVQFELDPPFSLDAIPGSARSSVMPPPAAGPGGETTGLYARENDLVGLSFDTGGTMLYLMGGDTDTVRQYSLDSPYDIRGGISFEGLFYIGGEAPVPGGLEMGPGGANMYVAAETDASVYRYALAEAFNVSTAVYTGDSLSVLSNETRPTGVRISHDGRSLFVAGEIAQRGPDSVFRYDLFPPFDITSAAYAGRLPSVAEATMQDLAFADGGMRLYIAGHLTRSIHHYELAAPYELGQPVSAVLDVRSDQGVPEGSAFSGDGRHVFVIGRAGPDGMIHRYPLDIPYDLASAGASDRLFEAAPRETKPRDIEFSSDGMIMFTIGHSDNIVRFNLGAPYDIGPGTPPVFGGSSPVTFGGNAIDISAQIATGLEFSPDGTSMYVTADNLILQYALDTPYDPSSASSEESFDLRLRPLPDGEYTEQQPADVAFSPDGTRMFVSGNRINAVHTYALGEPFDATTAVHDGLFNLVDFDDDPRGIEFSADGLYMVITNDNAGGGSANNALVQYAVGSRPLEASQWIPDSDAPGAAETAALRSSARAAGAPALGEAVSLGVSISTGDAPAVVGIPGVSGMLIPADAPVHADSVRLGVSVMPADRPEAADATNMIHLMISSGAADVPGHADGVSLGLSLSTGDAPGIAEDPGMLIRGTAGDAIDLPGHSDSASLGISLNTDDAPGIAEDPGMLIRGTAGDAIDAPGHADGASLGLARDVIDAPAVNDTYAVGGGPAQGRAIPVDGTDAPTVGDVPMIIVPAQVRVIPVDASDTPLTSDGVRRGISIATMDVPAVSDVHEIPADIIPRVGEDGPALSDGASLGLARSITDAPAVNDTYVLGGGPAQGRAIPVDGTDAPTVNDMPMIIGPAQGRAIPVDGTDEPAVDDMPVIVVPAQGRVIPVDASDTPMASDEAIRGISVIVMDVPAVSDVYVPAGTISRDGKDSLALSDGAVLGLARTATDAPVINDTYAVGGGPVQGRIIPVDITDAPTVNDIPTTGGIVQGRIIPVDASDMPLPSDGAPLGLSRTAGDAPIISERVDGIDSARRAHDMVYPGDKVTLGYSIHGTDEPRIADREGDVIRAVSGPDVGDTAQADHTRAQAPVAPPPPRPRSGGGGGGSSGTGGTSNAGSFGYDASFGFSSNGVSASLGTSSLSLSPGAPLVITPVLTPGGTLSVYDMELLFTGAAGKVSEVYYNRVGAFFDRECSGEAEQSDMVYSCDESSVFTGPVSLGLAGGLLESITVPIDHEFTGTLSMRLRDSQGITLATHDLDRYRIVQVDTPSEMPVQPAAEPAGPAEPAVPEPPEARAPEPASPAEDPGPEPPAPQGVAPGEDTQDANAQDAVPGGDIRDAAPEQGIIDVIIGFFRSILGL
ncbi:hypothetical protein CENSYa_0842 [Cenarchaeum symbiosum A]|uniref:Uncharacterized protein n=1 Tax=Cenarchaeum symbiosum (strain A) TaxID=414004 RepID=A0RVV8_CENSY|nr:hypothetical protein CENSYa_0842 [Cenarchaeum symbiosum A]